MWGGFVVDKEAKKHTTKTGFTPNLATCALVKRNKSSAVVRVCHNMYKNTYMYI